MTLSKPSITLPKPTPLQISLVALLMLSAVINYVDRQATAVVSPVLMKELALDKAAWGWVGSSFFGVYVISSWLGGIWIDKVGVRKGLLVSTIIWSIAAVGHAFAHDFWSLVFWRMMLALGEGPGGACQLKGVRRVLPPHLRDAGTGIVGSGSLLGALIAPVTVAPLAHRFGWQAAFLITGAIGLLWVPFWIVLTRNKKANLDADHEAPGKDTEAVGEVEGLNFRSWGVWATLLAILFTIPPTVFTLNFLPSYLTDLFSLGLMDQAKLQWMPFAAMDAGQILGGFAILLLLKRGFSFLGSRRAVLALGMVGSTLMLGMLFASGLQGAMLALVAGRFFFQFGYTALLGYGMSSVPERQAAQMNGVMNATFGICNFIFNPVIGNLAQHWGYPPVLAMVSVLPIVGLLCFLVCSARHNQLTGGRATNAA